MRRAHRMLVPSVVLAALGGGLVGLTAGAADDDLRFFQQLRERRLFSLAEAFGRERLAEPGLSPAQRARITAETVRVIGARALQLPARQRDAAWTTATDLAAAYQEQPAHELWSVLVRVQLALALAARGELERLEAEVSPSAEAALATARASLRAAARELEAIDKLLADAIPAARRNPLRPGERGADSPDADELTALQHYARRYWVLVLRNQGLTYPPDSADRAAALGRALQTIGEALPQVSPDPAATAALRLEQLRCALGLGDLALAGQLATSTANESIPPDLAADFQAEALRVTLASQRLDAADQLAEKLNLLASAGAEPQLAVLEHHIARWRRAADDQRQAEVAQWRARSLDLAKQFGERHGGYWARRAEILLVKAAQGRGDGSLQILVLAANDFYLKGQLDEALATYDRAALTARQAGDAAGDFEWSYKAALIQEQRQQFPDAATRFRQLALRYTDHLQAAKTHLSALVNLRRADPAAPSQGEWLNEHLAAWPMSETAAIAAMWLGEHYARLSAWRDAVQALDRVPPSAPFCRAAWELAARAWRELMRTAANAADATQLRSQAADAFAAKASGPDGQWSSPWTAARRFAALEAARLRLESGASGFVAAEAVLTPLLAGQPPLEGEGKLTALAYRAVALAADEARFEEGLAQLAATEAAAPETWLAMLGLLEQLLGSPGIELPTAARRSLHRLTLHALGRVEQVQPSLTAQQQQRLDELRARAVAATAPFSEARPIVATLAERHPDNGAIQQTWAELLAASDNAADLQLALEQWRRVASRLPPRSQRWYQAKYAVAATQLKLGDKPAAAKLIRYLQATEDLAAAGFAQPFADLLEQCEIQ